MFTYFKRPVGKSQFRWWLRKALDASAEMLMALQQLRSLLPINIIDQLSHAKGRSTKYSTYDCNSRIVRHPWYGLGIN